MVNCDILMTMKAARSVLSKEQTIPSSVFKAKCLSLFDEVASKGHSFVVTKRGRPVARVTPLWSESAGVGLQGSLLHEEDLLSPIAADWESL